MSETTKYQQAVNKLRPVSSQNLTVIDYDKLVKKSFFARKKAKLSWTTDDERMFVEASLFFKKNNQLSELVYSGSLKVEDAYTVFVLGIENATGDADKYGLNLTLHLGEGSTYRMENYYKDNWPTDEDNTLPSKVTEALAEFVNRAPDKIEY